MSYRIVFFDVDGTLTDYESGNISLSTKLAVKDLITKGYIVVAATGRPLSMCKQIQDLGIETFITANGGLVKYKENVIHKVPMNKNIVLEVMEFAHIENNGLSFYTEDFSMNGVKEKEILVALKETLSLDDYPVTNPFILDQEIYLLCLFANNETVQKYIQSFPHLTFKRWHPYVLNVLQEDVSKSLAIVKTLEYFGIDKSEAIAFGDGENDMDMLELVDLGIAMGNATEKLKDIAGYVTKKSSEDGIQYALKKLGII
ncbi:Cof-type HAD-IIB family hydrolase [Bacillus horti]|uniref:Cof subfamily protein (Haloacid dehalogenase superfamily) n=1 Tax=Caldalkalibacillus horti TaxID=77523 RepID=A0ABT9VYQ2_9BACI|nr:Cof-type HAD-IIB family hydrolase [Bacillus horti]MDQ0165995.1 Cof subfamily protein (haloacid dehalogenase superfamily) [Bacillus horti]